MSRSTRFNLVALLTFAGGVCLLGSLALPWFAIDAAGIQRMMTAMLPMMQQQFPTMAGSFDVNSPTIQTILHQSLLKLQDEMVGYKVFHAPVHFDAVAYGIVGAMTLWVAAQIFTHRTESSQQPGQLITLAVLGLIRPVYGLMHPEGGSRASDFVSPGLGLYVALGAGAILGAAAFVSMLSEPAHAMTPSGYVPQAPKPQAGSNVGEQVHGAYAPVTAYVPGGPPTNASHGLPKTAGRPIPDGSSMPRGPAIPDQPRGAYPQLPVPPGGLPPTGPPAPQTAPHPVFGAPLPPSPTLRPGPTVPRGLGERSGSVPPPDEG